MKVLARCIIGFLLLCGCATHTARRVHGDDAFSVSGYTSIKLEDGTYRIVFLGESVTTSGLSADFARLRSAQIALNEGYKFFFINKYFVTPTAPQPLPDAAPSHNGLASPAPLPTNTLIVRCFKKRPTNTPSAVYDAADVLNKIRSRYGLE